MPGLGIVIGLGRGLLAIVAWMGRALAGEKAMLWVRVFIIGLFLSQIVAFAGAYVVVHWLYDHGEAQDTKFALLLEKLDTLKTARDGQLTAMAATDLRLTREQGELRAAEVGLREQVTAMRSDMQEIKGAVHDLTRHVMMRDRADAAPNGAWPPAIRDRP